MAQAKAKTDVKAASNEGTVHPKQHVVNVVMTDKTKFQILTTWGKEGDTLTLDVDTKNHPAWQEKGQSFINANDERVAKFKSKFGSFDFVSGKKEEDKK